MDSSPARAFPIWLRLLLLLVTIETLRVAVGLVAPPAVNSFLPWPASPLNARFIASLYGSIGLALLAAQMARSYAEVRILIAGIFVASILILVITLARIAVHPNEVRPFPVLWVGFYILDPLLTALALWRFGWPGRAGGDTGPAAAIWIGTAVVLGGVGAVGLAAPSFTATIWPWTITQPQAQIYSAFFLALAVSSVLAARERNWTDVRWLALVQLLLPLLALISSLLHLARFRPGVATSLWFAALAALLLAYGGLFALNAVHGRWKDGQQWSLG